MYGWLSWKNFTRSFITVLPSEQTKSNQFIMNGTGLLNVYHNCVEMNETGLLKVYHNAAEMNGTGRLKVYHNAVEMW